MAEEKTSADLSHAGPAVPDVPAAQPGAAAGPQAQTAIPESVLQDLQKAAADPAPGESGYRVPGASPQEPFPHRSARTAEGTTAAQEPEPQDSGIIGEQDIEFLLNQAEQALSSIDDGKELPPGIKRFELDDFSGSPASEEAATLDLVRDVELDVNIELGRTHMHLSDVLRLKKGSVVPLDKLAGDPVDIYVNDRLIARGEVLVLNDNFCVRVAELVVGDNTAKL